MKKRSVWFLVIFLVTNCLGLVACNTNPIKNYVITFENYDGTLLQSSTWEAGTIPVYSGETPIKPGDNLYSYGFNDWYPEITTVKEDTTYIATYWTKQFFGSYPQTKVTDSTLISTLNSAGGTLPTVENDQTWTSYGFYICGYNTTNFMWYKDVTNGEDKYRGVYFTQYRPQSTISESSTDNSHQDDNGYLIDNCYWFKYEPIAWDILSVDQNGESLVAADKILDSRDCYDTNFTRVIEDSVVYPNNYKESNIRSWLNASFYNDAFSIAEQSSINTTSVDNSFVLRWYTINPNPCEDTNDKLFLLSSAEVTNASYGFSSTASRTKQATDYAKAMGVSVYSLTGCSSWWLRSPYILSNSLMLSVTSFGPFANEPICLTDNGILPAFKINF